MSEKALWYYIVFFAQTSNSQRCNFYGKWGNLREWIFRCSKFCIRENSALLCFLTEMIIFQMCVGFFFTSAVSKKTIRSHLLGSTHTCKPLWSTEGDLAHRPNPLTRKLWESKPRRMIHRQFPPLCFWGCRFLSRVEGKILMVEGKNVEGPCNILLFCKKLLILDI